MGFLNCNAIVAQPPLVISTDGRNLEFNCCLRDIERARSLAAFEMKKFEVRRSLDEMKSRVNILRASENCACAIVYCAK